MQVMHVFNKRFDTNLFESKELKVHSLSFSNGEAGWDHPWAPEQQQYPVQSTGQTLHTEDPCPKPFEIHKSEEQHSQGGDQGGAGKT